MANEIFEYEGQSYKFANNKFLRGSTINGKTTWVSLPSSTPTSALKKYYLSLQVPKSAPQPSSKVEVRAPKTIKKSVRNLFNKNLKIPTKNGSWGKPLTITGGKNANFAWGRGLYKNAEGGISQVSSKLKFGTQVNSGGTTGEFESFAQLARHFQVTSHALSLNIEHFRIAALHRAHKIFLTSFKIKAFHSRGEANWPALATFTIHKRAKRGTGSRILYELGDLKNSIKVDEGTGKIFTDKVAPKKHKKLYNCYAGWHNEGEGTYGKGFGARPPQPYKKRQFIGHSTYLDPFVDNQMSWMVKRYLFDSVFLAVGRY